MSTLALPNIDFVPRISAAGKADLAAAEASADRDDQHTPQWLLDLVAELWPGGIDVDPCWSPDSLVRATITYDGTRPEQDGLAQPWGGRCAWCNPPYSRPGAWADRVARHAVSGPDAEGLLLVNVTTTTKWWRRWRPAPGQRGATWAKQRAAAIEADAPGVRAARVAFFSRRIGFLKDGVVRAQNRFDQKLLYWGARGLAFAKLFGKIAWVP